MNVFYASFILMNWKEIEFYLPEGGELGDSLLIPARYIGEALSPFFFFFEDAVIQEKV